MLRKHSLERTAEKCLPYIGGIFLRQEVCKQQPSLSIFIQPQREKHCSSHKMSLVWGEKSSPTQVPLAVTFLKYYDHELAIAEVKCCVLHFLLKQHDITTPNNAETVHCEV